MFVGLACDWCARTHVITAARVALVWVFTQAAYTAVRHLRHNLDSCTTNV